ncbi:MAG: hypothetical protein JSW38_11960 [Dehalococcoidia bacterium]|nr:MAG: hypothetical protein JSW38_11960 [Dehalococcoidia bacterium]
MDYVHQELGQEIQSISGTYTPLKELRLEHNGGDILSVIGSSVVDTACCGSGSFLYATVPGYIVAWKERTNESGLAVSQVEPVRDEATKREISKALRETENIYNVNFL